jgi:hypothetical protein
MSAFANAYLIPELIMNPVPEPGEPPKTKVMVRGLPGSKFTRQHAPSDAAFEHIKDGIRNFAQINSPLSSFGFGAGSSGSISAHCAAVRSLG